MRTIAISREPDQAHRVLALVSRADRTVSAWQGADVVTADGAKLPRGEVTAHIRNLILKAGLQGDGIGSTRRCCCAASPMPCAAPTSSARSPAIR